VHTTHDERQLTLRVQQLSWEADGVVAVRLRSLDGTPLPEWRPGAHLDLHLPGGLVRQYSLCGDPADRTAWRVAVLREPESRGGSAAVHERLRPGDVVDVVGPRNNFPLADAPAYLFIAGGIGITPLLPMIGEVAAAGVPWRLLYGGRTRGSMAFLEELQGHGDLVQVRPQDEHGLLDLDSALASTGADTHVYCCGPEPLLQAVEERCRTLPVGALHVERFAPKARPAPDPLREIAFEAVLQRSGRTVPVPPGRSILEALEDAGVDAPNSCREGICGTCETKVIDGLPDHRDSLLSEEEQADNATMMICVGRSRSDRIVLDLRPALQGRTHDRHRRAGRSPHRRTTPHRPCVGRGLSTRRGTSGGAGPPHRRVAGRQQ
jgi:ferredoxin-NADP reductase